VEEYGEDVNGLSPTSQRDKGQLASWMPIHYAAHWGKGDAMELLESYGARTDVADLEGKTSADLLVERKARMAKIEVEREAKAECNK
jgi:hypothetical protein